MPRHSDFDKLHSALMGTILFILRHKDLPLIGMCRHNPCSGVLTVEVIVEPLPVPDINGDVENF